MTRVYVVFLLLAAVALQSCAAGGGVMPAAAAAGGNVMPAGRPEDAVEPLAAADDLMPDVSGYEIRANSTEVIGAGKPETAGGDGPAPEAVELTPSQKLAADGKYAEAMGLELDDYIAGRTGNLDAFWAHYEADPVMNETLRESVAPHGTNSLDALGGGSTVSLKYTDSADPSAKAAVKPDQDLRQTMYRSEVAFFRLCRVLGCSFGTPVTRPVRWTRADFDALYAVRSSPKNRAYAQKFSHIIWEKENGADVVYAAYKEWIPSMTFFPIENTAAWSQWLKPGVSSYPELRDLLKSIIKGTRLDGSRNLSRLMQYAAGMSSRDLLRQLSDLTLVDFLTNNWDRYSGLEDNWGANCNFRGGGIIAVDNGAAFPPWHTPRVVRRLNLVQTFSRSLVGRVRAIDPDVFFDHLFPDATREEQKGRARFRERRAEALKYIDGLISKYGEDRVLVF